jgi:hypothetical protein
MEKWSIYAICGCRCLLLITIDQGLLVAGGGDERNGMEGNVVGIVGKEGSVGSGGELTVGIVGLVGIVGNGGIVVGIGSDGWVVGKVGCGNVGIEGKGGNVGWGKVGTTGVVCKRWRAAKLLLIMLEKLKTTKKAKMKKLREGAMTEGNSQLRQRSSLGFGWWWKWRISSSGFYREMDVRTYADAYVRGCPPCRVGWFLMILRHYG